MSFSTQENLLIFLVFASLVALGYFFYKNNTQGGGTCGCGKCKFPKKEKK